MVWSYKLLDDYAINKQMKNLITDIYEDTRIYVCD